MQSRREGIHFYSPISSQCKMHLQLPPLLEFVLVMHSVAGDGELFMHLHQTIGVSLSELVSFLFQDEVRLKIFFKTMMFLSF
jgi:hypothetical protein